MTWSRWTMVLVVANVGLLAGCLLVRDRTWKLRPDGTKELVDDKTTVNPDIPLGSFPYGEAAGGALAIALMGYNWWRRRDIQKQLRATVEGVECAGLTEEQIAAIRLAHQSAGVEKKVKKVLEKVRKMKG